MVDINAIKLKLIGSRDKVEYDMYFMTIVCLTATFFLISLCIFHLLIGLKLAPVLIAGGSSLLLLGMYFLVRFGTCLIIPKLVVSILGLILLDITWYAKFLSLGPVLIFIFAFGALLVWAWNGRSMYYMLLFYLINIIVLGIIEYKSPAFAFEYDSLQTRTIDIYLSFILYFSLLIFLLIVVKRDFMEQKEKAVKADKLKTAFLANLSHEIRTPMNSIIGFSNLLRSAQGTERADKYITTIQNSSDSLLRLIDELLDLSKIEAGYTQILNSSFSVKDLFSELQVVFTNELEGREKQNIKLEFTIENNDIAIRSDYLRLRQILSNLLNNAIKFSDKGVIKYHCRRENDLLYFTVSDQGPGIKEEDQKSIFERFIKLEDSGLNTDGAGIGLSIVKKMVQLLNGAIHVDSKPGSGATFTFSIPYKKPGIEFTSKQDSNKQNIDMDTKTKHPVLVVEDDRSSYLLIKEMLSPLNLDIFHVGDGKDAVEFVDKRPEISLILMDLKLPFMDGFEATKLIKQKHPEIVIIAQTAFAMPGDKELATEAGCDSYITKPLHLETFLKTIKSFID